MRRLLWLGIGLAIGALLFRKATQVAGRLTPQGLVSSATSALGEVSEAIRDFADDVRAGMAEHEAALREAAELDGGRLGAPPAPPVPVVPSIPSENVTPGTAATGPLPAGPPSRGGSSAS